jgi:hypothetical protein
MLERRLLSMLGAIRGMDKESILRKIIQVNGKLIQGEYTRGMLLPWPLRARGMLVTMAP